MTLKKIYPMLLSILFSCQSNSQYEQKNVKPHLREIDKIIVENISYITSIFPVYPVATGGSMMFDIEMVRIDFVSKEPLSIEVLREEIVCGVEDLLNGINSNEVVRDHLAKYPFDEFGILYSIYYDDVEISPTTTDIWCGALAKGNIHYETHSSKFPLETRILHKETYQEAKKIVLGEKYSEINNDKERP